MGWAILRNNTIYQPAPVRNEFDAVEEYDPQDCEGRVHVMTPRLDRCIENLPGVWVYETDSVMRTIRANDIVARENQRLPL